MDNSFVIYSDDTVKAFNGAKFYLSSLPEFEDRELLKESPLLIVFRNLQLDQTIPEYNGVNFKLKFEYPKEIKEDLIQEEIRHYQNLLNDKIKEIATYLRGNPFSRRAIIDTWSDEQKDLKIKAECLVYLLFRKTSNGLDMFVHMRANDASSKALINFHIFSAIHGFVARELKEKVGTYYHWADSYHIYR